MTAKKLDCTKYSNDKMKWNKSEQRLKQQQSRPYEAAHASMAGAAYKQILSVIKKSLDLHDFGKFSSMMQQKSDAQHEKWFGICVCAQ